MAGISVLSFSEPKYHHLGRETAILPVTWEDGWPKVMEGREPPVSVHVPNLPDVVQKFADGESFYDDFKGPELNLKWNFIREFFTGWKLGSEGLKIYGKEETLSDQASPAFIGRRQCHMKMFCQAELVFAPEKEGEEAGLTVLYSNKAHYDLAVVRKGGKQVLRFHKIIEDMEMESETVISEDGQISSVILWIEADRSQYHFGWLEHGEKRCLGSGAVKLLSTEVNWGFTGVYIGMYASGNGHSCETPAVFKSFVYKGEEDKTGGL